MASVGCSPTSEQPGLHLVAASFTAAAVRRFQPLLEAQSTADRLRLALLKIREYKEKLEKD